MSKRKAQRNEEMVKKRRDKWSLRQIAEHYNLNHKTVDEILKRELAR